VVATGTLFELDTLVEAEAAGGARVGWPALEKILM